MSDVDSGIGFARFSIIESLEKWKPMRLEFVYDAPSIDETVKWVERNWWKKTALKNEKCYVFQLIRSLFVSLRLRSLSLPYAD